MHALSHASSALWNAVACGLEAFVVTDLIWRRLILESVIGVLFGRNRYIVTINWSPGSTCTHDRSISPDHLSFRLSLPSLPSQLSRASEFGVLQSQLATTTPATSTAPPWSIPSMFYAFLTCELFRWYVFLN